MTHGSGGDAIMARTEMEKAPPIEQVVEQPAIEHYEPVPAARRTANSRTLTYGIPRERRLWTAALAAALLVASGGLGLLYIDDTNYQSADRALTTQNESLTGRNQLLMDQLKLTQTNLTATLGELSKTQAELAHPQLVIWNVAEAIDGSTVYLAGGVPDTFTYHLVATSTGSMNVSILTFQQFAKAVSCIENGVGSTNYCMHHSGVVQSWLGVTSVNFDFHDAEGCADYLSVFTSPGSITVTPNVSVTYNPASSATGVCA